jgi:hypothetical protein
MQHQSTISDYANIVDTNKHWSIRQANSRLQQFGLQSALEKDLNRQFGHDEKGIPMSDLSATESIYTSNPYLTGASMIQQPQSQAHRSLRHKTYGFQDPFAVAPMEAWQEIKDYNLRVNGLPTLDQMMRLHTYSPLTQSNFSSFLKRRNVQQNLNFLMELETHDKLWRAYLQSVDRQNRQRLSRFLESAAEKSSGVLTPHAMMEGGYVETPDTDDLLSPLPPQPLTPRSPHDAYASRMGDKSLNRHDLVQNAMRIYRTYCTSVMEAAQPILLPDDHRRALENLIEKYERPEPIVFDSARSHVFEILNVFYYPLFVEEVLYKNVSRTTSRVAMVLGMLLLILAYSIELSFIFLDSGATTSRLIPIAPFFFGWSFLLASINNFAWWFGLVSMR